MIMQHVLQQFIMLRTALSLQQSRPILAALAALAEGLRTILGKKTVVLFSQGFVTPVPHLKFAEYLRLTNLAPGRYQAVIETKDMVTRKSVKQEASFEIVP